MAGIAIDNGCRAAHCDLGCSAHYEVCDACDARKTRGEKRGPLTNRKAQTECAFNRALQGRLGSRRHHGLLGVFVAPAPHIVPEVQNHRLAHKGAQSKSEPSVTNGMAFAWEFLSLRFSRESRLRDTPLCRECRRHVEMCCR